MRETRYYEGELDGVVADDVTHFHLEQLDDGVFWIGLDHKDGSETHITISSKSGRAALVATYEDAAVT